MGYYIDEEATSLKQVRERLESTDLIPSQEALLGGIRGNFAALKKAGVSSVAELRLALKNSKSIASLAAKSGVEQKYLELLRRTVAGWFPKPQPLRAFDWLDISVASKLEQAGIKNTEQLYSAAARGKAALAKKAGLSANDMTELLALSELSRIQWVSPTFARVLVAAGYKTAKKVAGANPERLCEAVVAANENARFYKGKVGLRDIKRLVAAAAYVPGR